jgi:formiminoglutamate deiminase
VILWCERAWLGDDNPPASGVVIECEAEQIRSISTAVGRPPSGAERVNGLVIPGIANAHSHAFQRALRGRTHAATGSFWTWRRQMYELAGRLDPDTMFALARACFAEMALAGVTLVGEFHYVHHGPDGVAYEDPNAMGIAVIRAAQEAGVRITLLDTCYLHGGIEPDPVQRRFFDPAADAWAARVDALRPGARVKVGAAIHSMRAVQPESAAVVADWAAGHSAPLHAHVSEQPAENDACIEVYGATPTALLHYDGALSERFTAVHATHLTDEDIQLLADAGASCCLCPTTERDLADGIGPAAGLRDAGCGLTLGSDSNAIIEPFEESRALELDERLASGRRGAFTGSELLRAATAAGYRSLGWPSGGVLREGALADLVALDTGGVRLAGLSPEGLVDGVVFAGAAADVRDVIAGGEFIVRDRAHVRLDVARELAQSIAAVTG